MLTESKLIAANATSRDIVDSGDYYKHCVF
jgi:hypothetical protein